MKKLGNIQPRKKLKNGYLKNFVQTKKQFHQIDVMLSSELVFRQ